MELSKEKQDYIQEKYGSRTYTENRSDANIGMYNLSKGYSAWEFSDCIDIYDNAGNFIESVRNKMTGAEFEQQLQKKYGKMNKCSHAFYKLGNEYEVEYAPKLISVYKITSDKKELLETFNPDDYYWETRLGCKL